MGKGLAIVLSGFLALVFSVMHQCVHVEPSQDRQVQQVR